MQVIVDDQLAILIATDVLEHARIELPVLTTYGFRLRVAGALQTERGIDGVLDRLVGHLDDDERRSLLDGRGRVLTPDPVPLAGAVADARARYRSNLLAAEVVALSQATGHRVVLSAPNATGALRRVLVDAAVPAECWTLGAKPEGGLAVAARRSLEA